MNYDTISGEWFLFKRSCFAKIYFVENNCSINWINFNAFEKRVTRLKSTTRCLFPIYVFLHYFQWARTGFEPMTTKPFSDLELEDEMLKCFNISWFMKDQRIKVKCYKCSIQIVSSRFQLLADLILLKFNPKNFKGWRSLRPVLSA